LGILPYTWEGDQQVVDQALHQVEDGVKDNHLHIEVHPLVVDFPDIKG